MTRVLNYFHMQINKNFDQIMNSRAIVKENKIEVKSHIYFLNNF